MTITLNLEALHNAWAWSQTNWWIYIIPWYILVIPVVRKMTGDEIYYSDGPSAWAAATLIWILSPALCVGILLAFIGFNLIKFLGKILIGKKNVPAKETSQV